MTVFKNKTDLIKYIEGLKSEKKSLGFVPTMGALHQGHGSLIIKGLKDNDLVVVSIFVNPTQFDNNDDLVKYPRTLDKDVAFLETISEDEIIVYAPSVKDIYGNDVSATAFSFDGLEHEMEGRFREGHFDGVGTIVKRLFENCKTRLCLLRGKGFSAVNDYQKISRKA